MEQEGSGPQSKPAVWIKDTALCSLWVQPQPSSDRQHIILCAQAEDAHPPFLPSGSKSPPWLFHPFMWSPEVRGKEMRWYICRGGAACVTRTEHVKLREERDDREDTHQAKTLGLYPWWAERGGECKTDEGRDLCCRKLTLGAAMGGMDLNSSDLGRETSVSLLGVTLLGEGVSTPETLTEWKNQPAINQSA